MDLVIKEEPYRIKVGAEVYSVEYPSFEEAQVIAKEFTALVNDGEKALAKMQEWLMKLGLEEKFFKLKAIKSKHIMTIWKELNGVKK